MARLPDVELRRLVGFVAEAEAAAPAGATQLADVVLAQLTELVSADHGVRTHADRAGHGVKIDT